MDIPGSPRSLVEFATDIIGEGAITVESDLFVAPVVESAPGDTSAPVASVQVVETLTASGFRQDVLALLFFIPAHHVAWASGSVQADERRLLWNAHVPILSRPVPQIDDADDRWLEEAPSEQLLQAWRSSVSMLKDSLNPSVFAALQKEIVAQITSVAKASGGGPGVHSMSLAEANAIREIEAAFDAD